MSNLAMLFGLVAVISSWIASLFDSKVFLVFLCLGIAQTLVAVESGYLAIAALPTETSRVKKVLHSISFALLGLFLFALTAALGFLNDRAQRDSAGSVEQMQGKLDTSNGLLNEAKGTLKTISAMLISPKHSTSTDQSISRAQAETILKEIDQLQGSISQVVPSSQSHTLPVPPQGIGPLSSPPAAPNQMDNGRLEMELESLAIEIERIQQNTRPQRNLILQHGMPYPQGCGKNFTESCSQQIQAVNSSEIAQYAALQSRISTLGNLALTRLGVSNVDVFSDLEKAAVEPEAKPATLNEAYTPKRKYLAVANYLRGLEQQLRNLK